MIECCGHFHRQFLVRICNFSKTYGAMRLASDVRLWVKQKMVETHSRSGSKCGERNRVNISDDRKVHLPETLTLFFSPRGSVFWFNFRFLAVDWEIRIKVLQSFYDAALTLMEGMYGNISESEFSMCAFHQEIKVEQNSLSLQANALSAQLT